MYEKVGPSGRTNRIIRFHFINVIVLILLISRDRVYTHGMFMNRVTLDKHRRTWLVYEQCVGKDAEGGGEGGGGRARVFQHKFNLARPLPPPSSVAQYTITIYINLSIDLQTIFPQILAGLNNSIPLPYCQ